MLKNSGKQQIEFEYFESKLTMDEKTNSGLSDETVDQFGEFMKMIEGFYQDQSEIETPVGYPLRRATAHWDLTILDLDRSY